MADGCKSGTASIKGERRYPCGYPGCRWIFTRSNHVLRHHQRVHPGYMPSTCASSTGSGNIITTTNSNSSGTSTSTSNRHEALANSKHDRIAAALHPARTGSGGSLVAHETNTRLFKCDIIGCEEEFNTLTLLTRHKRYVHLMIAIQEQMNYMTANNSAGTTTNNNKRFRSSSPHHQPLATIAGGGQKSLAAVDLLRHAGGQSRAATTIITRVDGSNRLLLPHRPNHQKIRLQQHSLLQSPNQSLAHLQQAARLQQQQQQHSTAAKLLANAARKAAAAEAARAALAAAAANEEPDIKDEIEDDDDEEPPFNLPVEVVLQVDESKTWTPDCGAVDLTGPTSSQEQQADEDMELGDDYDQDMDDEDDDDDDGPLPLELVVGAGGLGRKGLVESFAGQQLQVNSVTGSELDDCHSMMADSTGKPKDRPYVCDVAGCSKAYTKHSHLVRHKVETHKMAKPEPKQRGSGTNFIPPPPINMKDRPFVCDYPGCRWSFKRQYHLDRHYMTHRISKDGGADGGLVMDQHQGTESEDEGDSGILHSPSIVTSSNRSDLNSSDALSGGTSLLLSPSPSTKATADSVPSSATSTRFAWPQLIKDRLVNCPACDLRFKNTAMAEQHFLMAHAGSSAATLSLFAGAKCSPTALKSSPMATAGLRLAASGKPKASSTPAEVSLLKKSRDPTTLTARQLQQQILLQEAEDDGDDEDVGAADDPEEEDEDDVQQALQFTNQLNQLKLLQALTKGNSNSAATVALLAAAAAATSQQRSKAAGGSGGGGAAASAGGDVIVTYDDDDGGDDERIKGEPAFRNNTWSGSKQPQRKPKEKGQQFVCDIPGCDKKFGRNCELTRHKLNHMDVWPYTCDWPGCGRKFKRKDVFKNHQRTHMKDEEQGAHDDDGVMEISLGRAGPAAAAIS